MIGSLESWLKPIFAFALLCLRPIFLLGPGQGTRCHFQHLQEPMRNVQGVETALTSRLILEIKDMALPGKCLVSFFPDQSAKLQMVSSLSQFIIKLSTYLSLSVYKHLSKEV